MNEMEMIKNKIDSLPPGVLSPSNHYWCVTCKKFFVLDKPVCPYMTGMCVNTPIAVENIAPESTESLEKFGLFYPKIPQRILNELIDADFKQVGRDLAAVYLDFICEWKFDLSKQQPLQTIKSFIILTTGCETAQRVTNSAVTFVLMDAGKIWLKSKVKEIVEGGLDYLRTTLPFDRDLAVDFIDILGEREVGKYYCAKCGMFFEFGIKRGAVTCPLMTQKCMFDPQHIEKVDYPAEKMVKQFEITPDIYQRFIAVVQKNRDFSSKLRDLLKDWKITDDGDKIFSLLMKK